MIVAYVALGALVLIWGVYPLLIGLVTWNRPAPRSPGLHRNRSVSVVIATRDDAAAIRRRIENCRTAAYAGGRIEIVVAVDAQASIAPEILALSGPDVHVVRGDASGGKAAALNAGVRESSGEVLVFADAHQRFDSNTISELVSALENPGLGAVSGRLELLESGTGTSLVGRYWRLERWLREREARLHSCIGVTGAVWAMPRSLWTPLPAGLILDDVFTPMRLVLDGHRVGFAKAARAFETRVSAAGNEYQRKVRTLTGVLQLCAWMPGLLLPIRNPVWAQFVSHKLLRLLTPYLLVLMAAGTLHAIASSVGLIATASLAAIPVVIACIPRRNGLPRLLREAALMQTAAVVAAANGARGRWGVWGVQSASGGLPPAGAPLSASHSEGRLSSRG